MKYRNSGKIMVIRGVGSLVHEYFAQYERYHAVESLMYDNFTQYERHHAVESLMYDNFTQYEE